MKNILKLFLFSALLAFTIGSCKKDESKDYFVGGTNPVLTSSVASGSTLPLTYANRDLTLLNLSWTNPNYQFTTGVSSQDVNYQVEIDTVGANFTNPKRQTIAISKDLSYTVTVGQFNDFLLNQLVLDTLHVHNLEIHVKSSLTNNSVILSSNSIQLKALPYPIPPKVTPPTTGALYLVGSATPGGDAHGWDNPVPLPTQQFTKINGTQYEITINLIGGKEYLFLPLNGDWGNKYACVKTADQPTDGGDFGYNGGNSTWNANFPAPAADGKYKISVDFQRGKYSVTKQ